MRIAIAVGVMQLLLLASSAARADNDPFALEGTTEDPDYTPSTCHLDDDRYAVAQREARLSSRAPWMIAFAVGGYGTFGPDRHPATTTTSSTTTEARHGGFTWRAGLEGYFDDVALLADVRRWDTAADAPADVPMERTLIDLSIGLYLHHVGMDWAPPKRRRGRLVIPAHCSVGRWDFVPLVGLVTLVGRDGENPALDRTEVAPVAGFAWRWLDAGPHLITGLELRPEVFYLPASGRAGARVRLQGVLGVFTLGPELLVVGNKEGRLSLDLWLAFEL